MAKRSRPWAEDIEKAIAKARLDERAKALGNHYHKLDQVLGTLDKLRSQITAMITGRDPDFREVEDPKPAPKRKAVTATAEHIDKAWQTLCNTSPRYAFLSPDNVAAVWGVLDNAKRRMAGAALKALVADGRAVVKRGKYAQAQPAAQTADGATSEAP